VEIIVLSETLRILQYKL